MTQFKQIYKCAVCGNLIEVLRAGSGTPVCCGKPMEIMIPKTRDEEAEKHLPVIRDLPPNMCRIKDGCKIKIGEQPHPMETDHYIEWIEIFTDEEKAGKKFLKPGDLPESDFYTRRKIIKARCYCNTHGLWEFKKENG